MKSPEGQAVLLAIAICARLDTMPLELRFAFIRALNRYGSQTWQTSFTSMNKTFMMQRQHLSESTTGGKPAFTHDGPMAIMDEAPSQHKKGGAALGGHGLAGDYRKSQRA